MRKMNGILFALLCAVAVATASPVSTHGQLSVTNNQIVDGSGKPPQLRGMSFFWDNWGSSFYNQTAVTSLANDWKASVIRAAIYSQNVSEAQNMIDWAIAAGIYVIIDNHTYCAQNAASGAQSFFSSVSNYVKSKGNPPNVIYEIYNEPVYADCNVGDPSSVGTAAGGVTSWATIKSYAQPIISAIRANDPKNLIVVGTPFYSQQVAEAQANPITTSTNIAYSFHFYASESSHMALLPRLRYTWCKPFPIFVTEWGTSMANGSGNIDQTMNNTWMGLIESLKLSWVNWSFYNDGNTSSALSGGSGTSISTNLTTSGTFVKKMLTTFAAGGAVSGISSSSVDCTVSSSSSSSRTGGGDIALGAWQAENYATITSETVDSSTTAQGGAYIGNTSVGGTTTYSITNNSTAGVYKLWIHASSAVATGSLVVTIDTSKATIPIKSTGSLTTWVDMPTVIYVGTGSHTMTFKYNGTANTYGIDAYAFSVPDSTDSITYNLHKAVVSTLQSSRKAAPQVVWDASHENVILPEASGVQSAILMNSKGQVLQEWKVGDSGKQLSMDLGKRKGVGLFILVLKGDFGYSTVQIPSVH